VPLLLLFFPVLAFICSFLSLCQVHYLPPCIFMYWNIMQVLDTPSGRLVQSLYESGCKLGVSSRGWASLKDLPGKRYKCIMNNFELITFDFVTEPSTKGAWLLPYSQRCPVPIPTQQTAEALSRLGIGSVLPEQLQQLPHVQHIRVGFADFQRRLRVRCSSLAGGALKVC
jgi:hypothetical protein